jgi:muramidase (phage lysozyme)
MSIFRETFPQFIVDELDRRQSGMLARTPQFIHELNTRSAWVRMTSGVNYEGSNELAKKYVLQGGTLNNSTSLKFGLGSKGNSSYDILSPGGSKHRLGIRPMPGITGVAIKNKGAYGSLQEATVSFTVWDIKQLEELELLYMRPGYTVLLEFGWDYTKPSIPRYDILNKKDINLNEAFSEVYNLIIKSKGNYDALLGYVTNYNWSARDDGGYDCTTTIISLGEVLESLKVNWIPLNTYAFDKTGKGLFGRNLPAANPKIIDSYEQGIIPGLLHELWDYLNGRNLTSAAGDTFVDPTFGTTYYLYLNKNSNTLSQNDRGGYTKPLGTDVKVEAYISLGSFCDLLNNYVLLKDINNGPISQVTAYETDVNGTVITERKEVTSNDNAIPRNLLSSPINQNLPENQPNPSARIPGTTADIPSSLKCIASPFAISTNLGVCLVRNDNWAALEIKDVKSAEEQEAEETTSPPVQVINDDIKIALKSRVFGLRDPVTENNNITFTGNIYKRLQDNIVKGPPIFTGISILSIITPSVYVYSGKDGLEADIEKLAQEFLNAVSTVDVKTITEDGISKQVPTLIFEGGSSFVPSNFNDNIRKINLLDYFYNTGEYQSYTLEEKLEQVYDDLLYADYDGNREIGGFREDPAENGLLSDNKRSWTRAQIIALLKKTFVDLSTNKFINEQLNRELPEVASAIADAASRAPGISSDIKEFLVPTTSNELKTVGNISNIYININFLYSQAISKNVASNDTQNKNVISIREYLQGILREVQNSLGNINDFDIQVDSRNAIGRIIDINYTGNPLFPPFVLQVHNINSVVRNYSFQSKIFPEMGSIIAISAQDPEATGRLGYDNATLIAWNEGIKDRLIPKRDFTSLIKLGNQEDPITFIYPFLTKMYKYFQSLQGSASTNINFAYGGLNFAYRDFLAYISKFDKRNNFKSIIPTELSVTLDGIGGIVIGNIFTINQDIIPKGYRSAPGRKLAYITTKINHSIQDNDWTTTLSAYPIIFEYQTGLDLAKDWNNQEYPGANPGSIRISINGVPIVNIPNNYIPLASKILSFGNVSKTIPLAARPLLDTIAYAEGTAGVSQNGYDVLVGFGQIPAWTPDYISSHPNVFVPGLSTAAGRYQIIFNTWQDYGGNIPFNKENQDIVGWKLIKDKRSYPVTSATQAFLTAKQQITSNNIDVTTNPDFIDFLNKNYLEWASLPNGSGQFGYKGQGGKYTPDSIYKVYIEAVKKY